VSVKTGTPEILDVFILLTLTGWEDVRTIFGATIERLSVDKTTAVAVLATRLILDILTFESDLKVKMLVGGD